MRKGFALDRHLDRIASLTLEKQRQSRAAVLAHVAGYATRYLGSKRIHNKHIIAGIVENPDGLVPDAEVVSGYCGDEIVRLHCDTSGHRAAARDDTGARENADNAFQNNWTNRSSYHSTESDFCHSAWIFR